MEQSTNEIKLVTKPKIVHCLPEIGLSVTKRLDDLNIKGMVATEDTAKSLKTLRATLNKEFADYEFQRKTIKSGVLSPYDEFEAVYKTEIAEKYNMALNTLKDKIASVEDGIKEEKKANVETYFKELCLSEKVDFIPFDKVGLEINLSTSEKAYKEKCNEFIKRVVDDLALIKTTEFEPEILTEYKKTLSASAAITTVQNRKAEEKIEAERIKRVETNNRIAKVKALGLNFNDFSNSYIYNDSIYISSDNIENFEKDNFTTKLIEIEEAIKLIPVEPIQQDVDFSEPVKPVAAPLAAPTLSKPAELVTASFQVTASMPQLTALGQYMKSNNITYKNI